MDDDFEWLAIVIGFLILIAVVVYVITLIAGVIATVAGAAGTAWGGGTAIVNYCKSFKENMIDSNKVTV